MLWRLSRRDLRRFASFFSIFCVGYFILTTTTYKKKEDSHSFLCLATWSRKLGTVDTMELFILGREEHSSLRIGMSVDTTDRQTDRRELLLLGYMMLTKKYWKETWQGHKKRAKLDKMADLMLIFLSDISSCVLTTECKDIQPTISYTKNPFPKKKVTK